MVNKIGVTGVGRAPVPASKDETREPSIDEDDKAPFIPFSEETNSLPVIEPEIEELIADDDN